MFATDYSRAEKLVNAPTENFSKNHGEIPVQIDINPTLPIGIDFSLEMTDWGSLKSLAPSSVLRTCFGRGTVPSFPRRRVSRPINRLDTVFQRYDGRCPSPGFPFPRE